MALIVFEDCDSDWILAGWLSSAFSALNENNIVPAVCRAAAAGWILPEPSCDWLSWTSRNYFSKHFSFSSSPFRRAAVKGPDDTFIIMDVPTQMTRAEQATREVPLSRDKSKDGLNMDQIFISGALLVKCWICFAAFILFYIILFAG